MDPDETVRVLRAFEAAGLKSCSSAPPPWDFTDSCGRPRIWIWYCARPIKEIEGIRVRVATPAALYRLKKGTVRAIDHQDAAALRERFDLKDEN